MKTFLTLRYALDPDDPTFDDRVVESIVQFSNHVLKSGLSSSDTPAELTDGNGTRVGSWILSPVLDFENKILEIQEILEARGDAPMEKVAAIKKVLS